MSKFDYESFCGDYEALAFNKEKYTKEKAIEIVKKEFSHIKKPRVVVLESAYVRHRAGVNEDNEPCVGWWLEEEEHKRSCPVYAFRITHEKECEYYFKEHGIKLEIVELGITSQ